MRAAASGVAAGNTKGAERGIHGVQAQTKLQVRRSSWYSERPERQMRPGAETERACCANNLVRSGPRGRVDGRRGHLPCSVDLKHCVHTACQAGNRWPSEMAATAAPGQTLLLKLTGYARVSVNRACRVETTPHCFCVDRNIHDLVMPCAVSFSLFLALA